MHRGATVAVLGVGNVEGQQEGNRFVRSLAMASAARASEVGLEHDSVTPKCLFQVKLYWQRSQRDPHRFFSRSPRSGTLLSSRMCAPTSCYATGNVLGTNWRICLLFPHTLPLIWTSKGKYDESPAPLSSKGHVLEQTRTTTLTF